MKSDDKLHDYLDRHMRKMVLIRSLLYPDCSKPKAYLKWVAEEIMRVYAMSANEGETWNETANRYAADKPEGAYLLKEAEAQWHEAQD